jgi:photosystem II stability/assembly factor-like uncharacterized protein
VALKRLRLPALAAAIALLAAAAIAARDPRTPTTSGTLQTPQELLEHHYYEEAIEENKAPEDFYLFQKIKTGGTASPQAFARAAQRSTLIGRQTAAAAPRLGRKWQYVGPSNIGARVVDIAVDPQRENTIYVASASGGVWKSTDAGRTHEPIWSERRTQSIGALVMAQNGDLYAGTGETNPGGGSLTYGGDGIYKSTNRGRSWHNVGLRDSSTIGRIAVDPNNARHVLVAVSGNLFEPGGQRGLYESKDGGRTWERILKPENNTT